MALGHPWYRPYNFSYACLHVQTGFVNKMATPMTQNNNNLGNYFKGPVKN